RASAPQPADPQDGDPQDGGTRELPVVEDEPAADPRPRPAWAEETPMDDLPSLTDTLLGSHDEWARWEQGADRPAGQDPRDPRLPRDGGPDGAPTGGGPTGGAPTGGGGTGDGGKDEGKGRGRRWRRG
ncbi:hypothetical protein ACWEQL_42195, partial [Kitasatospora sp. NPDC004240]